MADPVQFEVTIPSDTAEGHEVQEKILSMLTEHGFADRDLFGVKLALEEAIVNAIKHGNGMDPDKSVRVACHMTDEQVCIIIEDEGEGFTPEDVPDPTDDDNLDKPSGRGLMLIRSFMSDVVFNDKGNCLTMKKIRSVENDE